MKRSRDAYGRYSKEYRTASRWEKIIVLSLVAGVAISIGVHALRAYAQDEVVEPTVTLEEVIKEPKTVRLEVQIDWTEERIKEEVWMRAEKYNTFPQKMWNTIKCENSQLDPELQSYHILDYGREQSYGLAQFHIPSGNKTAEGKVITKEMAQDPEIALDAMAYHFSIGNARLWTCFRDIYQ